MGTVCFLRAVRGLCKSWAVTHVPHRDVQDNDVRQGDCNAFEWGNVGGHEAARLLPTDIRKADREWIRGSGGLDGTLKLYKGKDSPSFCGRSPCA